MFSDCKYFQINHDHTHTGQALGARALAWHLGSTMPIMLFPRCSSRRLSLLDPDPVPGSLS